MKKYDVIVIGSGAGGLSAAIRAAKGGLKVLLLEASSEFGGYINPFKRRGYTFDTGLHYLGQLKEGQGSYRLLQGLGIADKLKFVELNPEGFDRHVFQDKGYEFVIPAGKERLRERLATDFPREKRAIDKFMKLLDDVGKVSGLTDEFSLGKLTKSLAAFPTIIKYLNATYKDVLDSLTSDPILKAVLACICATAGLPPKRASALMVLVIWAHYLDGAYYPHGGSGALKNAMIERAEKLGAELKSKSRVVQATKKGELFEVETEAQEIYLAQTIISNADPLITYEKILDPSLVPTSIRKKVKNTKYSIGAFYSFVGTDIDLKACGLSDANLNHHATIDFDSEYEQNLSIDAPSIPSSFGAISTTLKNPDGKHAPSGKHTLEIMTLTNFAPFKKWADKPSTKRGEEYENLKRELGLQLLGKLEQYIPNLTKHLDFVEFATPLTNLYWVNAPFGSCYGPEQTPEQSFAKRFAISSPIRGLFLCGAGTYGGGVIACMASGYIAGKKVAKFLKQ